MCHRTQWTANGKRAMLHFRPGHRLYGVVDNGDSWALWPVTHWESVYMQSVRWLMGIDDMMSDWAGRLPA